MDYYTLVARNLIQPMYDLENPFPVERYLKIAKHFRVRVNSQFNDPQPQVFNWKCATDPWVVEKPDHFRPPTYEEVILRERRWREDRQGYLRIMFCEHDGDLTYLGPPPI